MLSSLHLSNKYRLNRRVRYYFELAISEASKTSAQDFRSFYIGAVAVHSRSARVARNLCTRQPDRCAHAEYRVLRGMPFGAEVFIARKNTTGLALSAPCLWCQQVLRKARVMRAYFSINNEEYGVWTP